MSKIITQKCKIENCEGKGQLNKNGKRYMVKGYCCKHYCRLINNGDTSTVKKLQNGGRTTNILYPTYKNMKQRCYNKNNKRYESYGGRGIKICDRWLGIYGFSNFIEDMGERPEGHSLDRIDNNKGYSPDNCRWATKHQQAANKCNSNKVVGVSYDKQSNKYVATLKTNGLEVLRKYFKTHNEAIRCRKNAEVEYKI